jgi:membrane peptidoglycan carboxypeptidase
MLMDVKTTFPGNYTPLDYDRKFRGPVLVRRALANSLNIPSVEVMQKVGVEDALDEAQTLGISTLGTDTSNYGLSLVLGAGSVRLTELTDVYATFANKGWYNPITLVTKIVDKDGHTVYQYKPKPKHVLDTGVAFLISSILSDNKARAEEFGNVLNISRTAAVKTGTTEDFKDALTLGYTPQIAVGVWVGNNYNTPMDTIAGSLGAAPIWKALMEKFLAGTPVEAFKQPDGVQKLYVCRSNGYLVRNNYATSSAMAEYFLDGTGPTRYCTNTPRPTSPQPTITITVTPPPQTQPTTQPDASNDHGKKNGEHKD